MNGSAKHKILLAILFIVLVGGTIFLITPRVNAAPAPSKVVVNNESKECGMIPGGDECTDCFPPEGWEILGYETELQCPADYAVVEVDYTCQPFKVEHCCSEGHSGAHGDCEDMVINPSRKDCAFVEDIQGCDLPAGWQSKPGNTSSQIWACPANYDWTADVICETPGDEPPGAEDGFNLFPRIALAEGIIIAGCSLLCLAGAAGVVAVAVILLRRRK